MCGVVCVDLAECVNVVCWFVSVAFSWRVACFSMFEGLVCLRVVLEMSFEVFSGFHGVLISEDRWLNKDALRGVNMATAVVWPRVTGVWQSW